MKFKIQLVQRLIKPILLILVATLLIFSVMIVSAKEDQPAPPKGGPDLPQQAISAGEIHTCGLLSDGSLLCWGLNNAGQTNVPAGTYTQVSAG